MGFFSLGNQTLHSGKAIHVCPKFGRIPLSHGFLIESLIQFCSKNVCTEYIRSE